MESRKGLYGNIRDSEVYGSAVSCGAFCGCMCSCGNCIGLGDTPTKVVKESELVHSLIDIK